MRHLAQKEGAAGRLRETNVPPGGAVSNMRRNFCWRARSHLKMARALALVFLALVLVGSAAAATIRGTARPDRIQAADGRRQTIACGRGLDIVTADARDVTRSDCETVGRRVGGDATSVAGAQHATVVEPDSFAFGSTVVATYQVGRFSGGGSGATGWASSTNGGRTWRSGTLPGVGHASDPSVAYDSVHGVWLVTTLGISAGPTSIDVSRSTDGSRWSRPLHALESSVQTFDKEWITCDNWLQSPRRGTCYIAYTNFRVNRIALIASIDGGVTWSAPVYAQRGDVVGAQPAVLPDGTVVVAWLDRDDILASRSRDGGVSLDPAVVAGRISFNGFRGLRAPPLPSIDVERGGRLLLAWPDCRFRSSCSGNDVVVSTSQDGLTWTQPARVTHGGPSYLIPGIAADPASDRLAVVAVVGARSGRIGAALMTSTDGSRWSAPRRLDTRPMSRAWLARAEGLAFLGDYLSASWAGGRAIGFVPLALPPRGGRFRQSLYAASTR
jgi:hypothetical protein